MLRHKSPSIDLVKVAWVRDPDYPAGKPAPGRLKCPCGQAPLSEYNPIEDDILCACGTLYRWDGWILSLPNRPTAAPTDSERELAEFQMQASGKLFV